jgi:hypothetical protein
MSAVPVVLQVTLRLWHIYILECQDLVLTAGHMALKMQRSQSTSTHGDKGQTQASPR